jgi:hypothetical protein
MVTVFGVIPAVFGVAEFAHNITDLFEYAEKHFAPELTYELQITRSRLRIGEQAEASIVRRSKKDRTVEPVVDRDCKWSYSPALAFAITGAQCSHVVIRPTKSDVANAAPDAVVPVKVDVRTWPVGGSPPKDSSPPDASGEIEVVNQFAPEVEIGQTRIAPSQRSQVSVKFPPNGAPASFSCRWTPPERFVDASQCSTEFVAPSDTSDATSTDSIDIHVEIIPSGQAGSASANARIFVTRPAGRYYLFVLDATERTRARWGALTQFEGMLRQVESAIAKIDVSGGFLGVTAFGGSYSGAGDPCSRVRSIYPLSPIAAGKAGVAVHGLAIGGRQAPLANAIANALKEYAPYKDANRKRPADRFFFVVITNGGDTCGAGNIVALLNTVLEPTELRGVSIGDQILRVVMVESTTEEEHALDQLLESDAYAGSKDGGTAILKVTRPQIMTGALDALAGMSSPDPSAVVTACKNLINLFFAQRDKHGETIVGSFCKKLT